jgi:hypothetical protein
LMSQRAVPSRPSPSAAFVWLRRHAKVGSCVRSTRTNRPHTCNLPTGQCRWPSERSSRCSAALQELLQCLAVFFWMRPVVRHVFGALPLSPHHPSCRHPSIRRGVQHISELADGAAINKPVSAVRKKQQRIYDAESSAVGRPATLPRQFSRAAGHTLQAER